MKESDKEVRGLKTLKGYEAIEVAERYDILLYKFTTQSEVSAMEAREDIENRGNANAYIIEAWPDTEDEANQIALRAMKERLRESRTPSATIEQLSTVVNERRLMHPAAMELALNRLAERGSILMQQGERHGEILYVLAPTLTFTDEFLAELREVVCDDCAHLDLGTPFHESCLFNLFDFLHNRKLKLEDLREAEIESFAAKTQPASSDGQGVGLQWLSRTASVTKERWKTVVQPMIKSRIRGRNQDATEEPSTVQPKTPANPSSSTQMSENQAETSDSGASISFGELTSDAMERPKITKDELIKYLRSVEILDDGELKILQMERDNLRRELEQKESQIQQLVQQKAQIESQFAGLQQDMDVLVRAMRIAKRHDGTEQQPFVIDATYEPQDRT